MPNELQVSTKCEDPSTPVHSARDDNIGGYRSDKLQFETRVLLGNRKNTGGVSGTGNGKRRAKARRTHLLYHISCGIVNIALSFCGRIL